MRYCLCFMLFLFPCLVGFSEERWASTEINVRTGTGTDYEIMGILYKNEKVEVFDVVNGWAKILFEDVEGYVKYDLLLAEKAETATAEDEETRIAAEEEQTAWEKEQKRLRIWRIIKPVIFGIVGVVGTIIIVRSFMG